MSGRAIFKRKNRVQASLHLCTSIMLLVSIAVAQEARGAAADCQAFGRVYRDGESFTLSTGEYGDCRVYICTNGKWNDYDGSVLPLHRPARPASAPRSATSNAAEQSGLNA
jgi:hypothetical protein